MSKNGIAMGRLVFVNSANPEDFMRLESQGIDLRGKIGIARKGGRSFRGVRIDNAARFGLAGLLIFTDSQGDCEFNEKKGYAQWPSGPARNEHSLEYGSVNKNWIQPGNPLQFICTGNQKDEIERIKNELKRSDTVNADNLPTIADIPSLPISFADAKILLRSLQNRGSKHDNWQNNQDDFEYWTGPSDDDAVVTLRNFQQYSIRKLYNVIAYIGGELASQETVILGNHRDAWGPGALDPHSGTGVLVEVARFLGKQIGKGWRPMRPIILASWDGEEPGMIGSTGWAMNHRNWIAQNLIAYLNIDGFFGAPLYSQASSALRYIFSEESRKTRSPDLQYASLAEEAADKISIENPELLRGISSDHAAFVYHSTVPSVCTAAESDTLLVYLSDILQLDIRCDRAKIPYHYHSIFDSFEWYDQHGDPGFVRSLRLLSFTDLI